VPREKMFIGTKMYQTLATFSAMGHPWNMIPGVLKQYLIAMEENTELQSMIRNTNFFGEGVTIYDGFYPLINNEETGRPCYAR